MSTFEHVVALNRNGNESNLSFNHRKYYVIEREILQQFLLDSIQQQPEQSLGDLFGKWLQGQALDNPLLKIAHDYIAALSPSEIKKIPELDYKPYAEDQLTKKHFWAKLIQLISQMNILMAAVNNAIFLLLTLNVELPLTFLMITPFLENALPVAFIGLTLSAFLEVKDAFFNKKLRNRDVVIAGGVLKSVLASMISLISLGVLSANPIVLPVLLFGYMMVAMLSEHKQLKNVVKENNELDQEIEARKKKLIDLQTKPEGGDAHYERLLMELAEMEQKAAMLTFEERSLRLTRNLRVIGLISTGVLLAACFFPPLSVAALAIMTVALSLLFAMSLAINQIQTQAKEEIAVIEKKGPVVKNLGGESPADQKNAKEGEGKGQAASQLNALKETNPGFFKGGLFFAQLKNRTDELQAGAVNGAKI